MVYDCFRFFFRQINGYFKLECKKSANISAFSLVTLAGTSVYCQS